MLKCIFNQVKHFKMVQFDSTKYNKVVFQKIIDRYITYNGYTII